MQRKYIHVCVCVFAIYITNNKILNTKTTQNISHICKMTIYSYIKVL